MTPTQLRQSLLLVLLFLLGIGTVAVYSSSTLAAEFAYGDGFHFVKQHLVAIGCGAALAGACLAVPYARLRAGSRWAILLSLALLVLVLVAGQEIGGARRWFRLGRLSLQPSEFAQLALVVYLADLLARKAGFIREFRKGVLPAVAVTGLCAGLVLLQPDLGTATVMGAVAMLLLIVANAKPQHVLGLLGAAAALLVVLIMGAEYRRRRIFAFLDPWNDPYGSGYQILQSYFALASGGLIGLGVGGSVQKLFYLPSAHTDFILAIIGEELGLVGTTAVLLAFALFLILGFRMAMLIEDRFGKYLTCGLVAMIGLEAMVNIGVVTGMLPTKGLPLPLISYGGTSMVMNLVACALIFKASHDGARTGISGALRD
ncbi:MAG TPA: putative lipid II flippase FtsW [bacterium]